MPSPTSILIATHFPLGLRLGAIYVGATIAAVFYGITILQTVIYYKLYPDDPWIFRYAVAVLWILDTLHVILTTHALYFYMIESFGDFLALFSIIWSFPLQLLVGMLIVVGVQALYAVRIWKLGRRIHMVIPWSIFFAVAASLGTGIYAIYDTYGLGLLLLFVSYANPVARYTLTTAFGIPTISTSIYVVFSTLAGADFCIAGTMCYYLDKGTSMSFSSTTKIVVGLMRLAVISGLATSACSLLTLVAFIAWPKTLIFIAIHFILPKLYINSMLAMLNARNVQRRKRSKGDLVNEKTPRFISRTSRSSTSDAARTKVNVPLSVMESGSSVPAMTFTREFSQ
ncbi:hypothetical protein IW261DRAFT_1602347 [Armillaria novae-zelandiae]|uniref:DUF6534 domain-containing protein n=1 Tax=Armillaria novae-zelandiae TaxID=153914 RepID=A0AA39ULW3_9AGAR|nr:hypothetical protein IW261DRAFT_1602347 [Armillaria novae-zelandiae]